MRKAYISTVQLPLKFVKQLRRVTIIIDLEPVSYCVANNDNLMVDTGMSSEVMAYIICECKLIYFTLLGRANGVCFLSKNIVSL